MRTSKILKNVGGWATAPLSSAGLEHHEILVAKQDSSFIHVNEASQGKCGLWKQMSLLNAFNPVILAGVLLFGES